MAQLIIGPLLRYVGERQATVWVETDAPCEVQVLGHRAATFEVEGHHYALVCIDGLEPGTRHPYEVHLDGRRRWPEPGSSFPPSSIHTVDPHSALKLAFGSCRVSAPHEPPYTLSKDEDARGRGVDALRALALRMAREPREAWPQTLLLLGDQVYADEVSLGALEFIRSRRSIHEPPGEEVADFEEYTRLYWDAWSDPSIRWLLSTVSISMIFDDHDLHDDWNTSAAWVEEMRRRPWWSERIVGAFTSYWVYQHLGNLSPRELRQNELWARVRSTGDAAPLLREFAQRVDRGHEGTRWSYCRDLGRTRLVVMDSRAGRVLDGRRSMFDEHEWSWICDHLKGDFDHLLVATTLPWLLAPGMHHLEAWNEAVCDGAWGAVAAGLAERIRQGLDLEHWAAFEESFSRLTRLLEEVAAGRHGPPPASIVALSGDVHHAYLAQVAFRRSSGARSAVYQATCSPVRNPLDKRERRLMRAAASRPAELFARGLARAARVRPPGVRWRLTQSPAFDNQVGTLELDRRQALLRLEKTTPGDGSDPRLDVVLERALASPRDVESAPAGPDSRQVPSPTAREAEHG